MKGGVFLCLWRQSAEKVLEIFPSQKCFSPSDTEEPFGVQCQFWEAARCVLLCLLCLLFCQCFKALLTLRLKVTAAPTLHHLMEDHLSPNWTINLEATVSTLGFFFFFLKLPRTTNPPSRETQ